MRHEFKATQMSRRRADQQHRLNSIGRLQVTLIAEDDGERRKLARLRRRLSEALMDDEEPTTFIVAFKSRKERGSR